jgi:hypothetical protein
MIVELTGPLTPRQLAAIDADRGLLQHLMAEPRQARSCADLRRRVLAGPDKQLSGLLVWMLRACPRERPTALQALHHPFFESVFKASDVTLRTEPFKSNRLDCEFLDPCDYRDRLGLTSRLGSTARLSLQGFRSMPLIVTRDSFAKHVSLKKEDESRRSIFGKAGVKKAVIRKKKRKLKVLA